MCIDNIKEFIDIKGKVINNIEVNHDSTSILFYFDDNTIYRMYHIQDCCVSVSVESIDGNLDNILCTPLVMAEVVTHSKSDIPINSSLYTNDESFTWTFYKFATVKGYVTIRWYGESNGCYSEEVNFEDVTNEFADTLKLGLRPVVVAYEDTNNNTIKNVIKYKSSIVFIFEDGTNFTTNKYKNGDIEKFEVYEENLSDVVGEKVNIIYQEVYRGDILQNELSDLNISDCDNLSVGVIYVTTSKGVSERIARYITRDNNSPEEECVYCGECQDRLFLEATRFGEYAKEESLTHTDLHGVTCVRVGDKIKLSNKGVLYIQEANSDIVTVIYVTQDGKLQKLSPLNSEHRLLQINNLKNSWIYSINASLSSAMADIHSTLTCIVRVRISYLNDNGKGECDFYINYNKESFTRFKLITKQSKLVK